MSTGREYTFDRVVRIVFAVVILAAAVWLVNVLKNVLLPFLVACLIAYMFEPFVQHNRRLLHLKGRLVAVLVTLFEAFFLMCILLYFVGPAVMDELHQMAEIMRRYTSTEIKGGIIPEEIHRFLRHNLDFESLSESLTRQEWMTMVEGMLQTTWSVISGSIAILVGIFNWFIVLLYVVFIMIDYDRLGRGFRNLVPPAYRPVVLAVGSDIKNSMNHYFRGQALIALIVGILFAIGFSIIGMPLAIVFGLFIGLLNLVPYLQLVSLIPAVILCIISSAGGDAHFWNIFLQCIAVYCIVQLIQDLYLTPRIMGKAMGLNPAIILLSLSVWGTLFGFVGLIIALPLTTLLLSYFEHYISGGHSPWERKRAETVENITEVPFDDAADRIDSDSGR